MFRLLIVEDEPIVRAGLIRSVPWNAYGIEIAGEAGNGREGLEQALSLHPDIILTDIKMPVMDGIQMTEQLLSIFPDIQVIFFTSFCETEYLLKAIDLGISNFLEKPATTERIIETVKKCAQKLEAMYTITQKHHDNENIIRENLENIQQTLFLEFLEGSIPADEFMLKARQYHIPIERKSWRFLAPRVSQSDFLPFLQVFTPVFGSLHPMYLRQPSSGYLLILLDGHLTQKQMESQFFPLVSSFASICCAPVFCTPAHTDLTSLVKQYAVLKEHIDISYTYETPDLCFVRAEAHIGKTFTNQEVENYIFRICNSISTHNLADYSRYMGEIRKKIEEYKLPYYDFYQLFQRISVLFSLFSKNDFYFDTYQQFVSAQPSLSQVYDCFEDFQKKYFGIHLEQAPYASLAMAYVESHPFEHISSSIVAKHLNLSTSYFCRIFKEQTNKTFTDWLQQVRLNKALKLLANPGYSISEIAESAGFSSYKQFSSYINKYTGLTATAYRKKQLNQKL